MRLRTVYVIGFIVLITTAFFSQGFHHFDEHFQILEFAALKLGLTTANQLPWEYHAQMRSALQPAIAYIAHKLSFAIGIQSPFAVATFLRLLSALASFYATTQLIKALSRNTDNEYLRKNLLLFSFLLWFSVYNFVRFSSENWCGISMALAVAALHNNKNNYAKYALAGIAMGFAFLFRFQAGFMVAGIYLWLLLIRQENIKWLFCCGLYTCLVIAFGALIDRWYYGEWILTWHNYFYQNIVQGKAAAFGIEPWYYYIVEASLSALPPFSLLYIVSIIGLVALKPRHIITFAAVPFLAIHMCIGHKEIRFMFPLLYFLPFAIASTTAAVSLPNISVKAKRVATIAFWISNTMLLLIVMLRPADSLVPLYRKIYARYSMPTTLYYIQYNPYFHVADISYYKRQNLNLIHVNSLDEIPQRHNGRILFATMDKGSYTAYKQGFQPIYASLPGWTEAFDFNHWQERTSIWRVYEVKQ